jgi:hypothetical protein
MSTYTMFYYLLGILALIAASFTVGIFIAGRLSRRHEAANQEWDNAQPANSHNKRESSPP